MNIEAKERQGGSVLPIHPPTTTLLLALMTINENVRVNNRPATRRTKTDELQDDREAKRLLDRMQKAQKRRNPKNAKGFG